MSYKALFVDFYGTLVAEDEVVIQQILQRVAERSVTADSIPAMARDWGRSFQELCSAAHGNNFKTQRSLELKSLSYLLRKYESDLDAVLLSEELFRYWRKPHAYEDATWFIENASLPVCVVSNIDNDDLRAAIANVGWTFDNIVTSESCKSYKPRPEVFLRALEAMNCEATDVLHIGDSLGSDVTGALGVGIDAAWVNRSQRGLPPGMNPPKYMVSDLGELRHQLSM